MSQELTTPSSGATKTFFVGSGVDDSGLNVYQFRILGHLHRRAGKNGRAFPSVASMAATCQIGERVVRRTLQELLDQSLITATKRPGRSTVYTPAAAKRDPLPISQGPPADQQDEGIQRKEFKPTPPPPAKVATMGSSEPPERSQRFVDVVPAERSGTAPEALGALQKDSVKRSKPAPETPERAVFDALGGYGIIGGKQQGLSRNGLTLIETKRICRRVSEGGGRAGAMIHQLEAQAGRKAEGLLVVGEVRKVPPSPPKEWVDELSAEEGKQLAEACRKFRKAS